MWNSDDDSVSSYESGDPDKYWWIRGDYPYGYPTNWGNYEAGEPSTEPVSPPIAELVASNDPVLPDLNDVTQALHARIHQLEAFVEDHDLQIGAADATIQELMERVPSLSTYIVTLWGRLQDSDKKIRDLTVALRFSFVAIVALLSVIVGRLI